MDGWPTLGSGEAGEVTLTRIFLCPVMSARLDLHSLVVLQSKEFELRRLEQRLAAIPGERESLDARVRDERARLDGIASEREEGARVRRQQENELADAEQDLAKHQGQELQVKTNEQLWALQAEMTRERERIDALEESILESMERSDELERRRQQIESDVEALETEARLENARIDASQAETEARVTEVRAEVERLAADIPVELLNMYRKVKGARGGIGVAEASDETCLACHFRLRPQLFLEVRKMEMIIQCDNCDRILFARDALDLPPDLDLSPPAPPGP